MSIYDKGGPGIYRHFSERLFPTYIDVARSQWEMPAVCLTYT